MIHNIHFQVSTVASSNNIKLILIKIQTLNQNNSLLPPPIYYLNDCDRNTVVQVGFYFQDSSHEECRIVDFSFTPPCDSQCSALSHFHL